MVWRVDAIIGLARTNKLGVGGFIQVFLEYRYEAKVHLEVLTREVRLIGVGRSSVGSSHLATGTTITFVEVIHWFNLGHTMDKFLCLDQYMLQGMAETLVPEFPLGSYVDSGKDIAGQVGLGIVRVNSRRTGQKIRGGTVRHKLIRQDERVLGHLVHWRLFRV